ncbi:hypothetical protein ACH4E8_34365 [Streptomyces sp. NPDC017979]|uniref:hypothetical protein n=1 Tax=Streptomyces sp. NPDC017979 TaxID=3365024 RepID=UPI00379AB1CC
MRHFHYVLTLEIPGVGLVTANDVITVDPGTTRSTVYDFVVEQAVTRMMARAPSGRTYAPPITHFWSLNAEEL